MIGDGSFQSVENLLKAIEEGIQSFRKQAVFDLRDVVELILEGKGKVIVSGVGKSGIIAHKIAATLASTGTPAVFLNAAESLHGDLGIVQSGDIVILVSNSGATEEIIRMVPSLRKINTTLIGFFNRSDAPLREKMDKTITLPVSREGDCLNLAPMCSSMMALLAGDTLAVMLQQRNNFTEEDFAIYHPGGTLGRRLLLTAADVMKTRDEIGIVSVSADLDDIVVALTKFPNGIIGVTDTDFHLVGVISDGDIRRTLLHRQLEINAGQLMSSNPTTVTMNLPLGRVLDVMEQRERKIYAVPVVDDEKRIHGIVRMHDVLSG